MEGFIARKKGNNENLQHEVNTHMKHSRRVLGVKMCGCSVDELLVRSQVATQFQYQNNILEILRV